LEWIEERGVDPGSWTGKKRAAEPDRGSLRSSYRQEGGGLELNRQKKTMNALLFRGGKKRGVNQKRPRKKKNLSFCQGIMLESRARKKKGEKVSCQVEKTTNYIPFNQPSHLTRRVKIPCKSSGRAKNGGFSVQLKKKEGEKEGRVIKKLGKIMRRATKQHKRPK